MATKFKIFIRSYWIFMLVAILYIISHRCVEGLQTLDKNKYGPKPKGTIKTIEALEVGDIIDCVDFYKQPAFSNPLFRNLKMAPRSYPSAFNKTSDPKKKIMQTWNKYGVCPKGTIPIRRTLRTNKFVHQKYPNDDQGTHEYAMVSHYMEKGIGGKAYFNVWTPLVDGDREFSLSQIWVSSGVDAHLNSVEAGWMVHPHLFHDAQTRLFIYWTRDGYNSTGCYNLVCPDFVQTLNEPKIAIGAALERISVYDGKSDAFFISYFRSHEGNWNLVVGDQIIGFYPRQLFTTLGDGADRISFGGEITNHQQGQRPTRTAMGSGHFSHEGYKKACFISHIGIETERYGWEHFQAEFFGVTKPKCYDLTIGPPDTRFESHFFFGGPGRLSHECE